MKSSKIFIMMVLIFIVFGIISCKNSVEKKSNETIERKVTKRIGQVIEIKPEKIAEYKALHADSNSGVRDLLTIAHMENFSIFIKQFDNDKWYLFAYYEYTGDNFEDDMAKLSIKQRNIDWLKVCDPIQIPFKGEKSWSVMEKVYYNK